MHCQLSTRQSPLRSTSTVQRYSRPPRRPVTQKLEAERTTGTRIRRAVLLGSLPIGLGAFFEVKARPPLPEGYAGIDPDEQQILQAKEYLKRANDLYESGEYEEAVEVYSRIEPLVPREYTLCMKSYLGRRDALRKLGRRSEASQDERREWLWGRGIRWPGWYIISAILIRNQFVDK